VYFVVRAKHIQVHLLLQGQILIPLLFPIEAM
jgi:hypothetical protein